MTTTGPTTPEPATTPLRVLAGPVRVVLSVDVGQAQDSTALVLVRHVLAEREGRKLPALLVEGATRLPLGVSYVQQARHLLAVVAHLAATAEQGADLVLALDATGVGTGLCDVLDEEVRHLANGHAGRKAHRLRVTITGAGDGNGSTHSTRLSVPKPRLLTEAQTALAQGAVVVPPGVDVDPELLRELASLEVTETPTGAVRFSAPNGQHDDLALAALVGLFVARSRWDPRKAMSLWNPARSPLRITRSNGAPADPLQRFLQQRSTALTRSPRSGFRSAGEPFPTWRGRDDAGPGGGR